MPLPETVKGLKDYGYIFKAAAKCRGCNQAIEWWLTLDGKNMPMSIYPEGRRIPHWADCPRAGNFKRE